MVRFIRDLPKSTPRSHFIISTPTAIIEVLPTDRPADFVVEVSKDQKFTTVYGIWGAVKVRQLFAEFVQERIVRSCQRVDVEEDKEPQPVIRVSPETLTELIRKTTIPKTLPEDVPSCQDSAVAEPPVIDEEPPYVLGPPVIDEGPPDGVRCPCPPGQELVGGACEGCPSWKKYSRRTCSCVSRCRNDKQCRRCETCRNGFCEPIHKKCPPGQKWDKVTCACVGECRPVHCQEGFWFNPKTCRCERKQPCDKKCPQGQHLDPAACKCVSDGTIPTKGCSSDSECGPRSVCRHGKCVPKEGQLEKPSRQEREQPVERVHQPKREREQPAERVHPSKQEREQPVERVHPSRQEPEQPAERAQPHQRKDQRQ